MQKNTIRILAAFLIVSLTSCAPRYQAPATSIGAGPLCHPDPTCKN